MDCNTLNERMLDYLDDVLDEHTRQDLKAHLDSCPECSVELDSLRETCCRLDRLPTESPGPGSRVRFEEMLRAFELAHESAPETSSTALPGGIRWPMAAAVALVLVLLSALIGYGVRSPESPAAVGDDTLTRYLMTVYEIREQTDQIPREQMRATGARYRTWEQELKEEGRLLDVALLRTERAASIREIEGQTEISALTVPDDREAMTYYWLIQARNYDEALRISRGCPMLSLGARVELREIDSWEPPNS